MIVNLIASCENHAPCIVILAALVLKMKVTLVSRSGREIVKGGIELSDSATVADLQEAIQRRRRCELRNYNKKASEVKHQFCFDTQVGMRVFILDGNGVTT